VDERGALGTESFMCLALYLAADTPFAFATIKKDEVFLSLKPELVVAEHLIAATGRSFVMQLATHYNCCCPLMFDPEIHCEQTIEEIEEQRKNNEIQIILAGMVEAMVTALVAEQDITMLVCWHDGGEYDKVDDVGVSQISSIRNPDFFEPYGMPTRHLFQKTTLRTSQ
jgi:hypothetical protein